MFITVHNVEKERENNFVCRFRARLVQALRQAALDVSKLTSDQVTVCLEGDAPYCGSEGPVVITADILTRTGNMCFGSDGPTKLVHALKAACIKCDATRAVRVLVRTNYAGGEYISEDEPKTS